MIRLDRKFFRFYPTFFGWQHDSKRAHNTMLTLQCEMWSKKWMFYPVALRLGSPVILGKYLTFELLANFNDFWWKIRSPRTNWSIGQTTIWLSLRIAQKPNSVSWHRAMKFKGSSNNLKNKNSNQEPIL